MSEATYTAWDDNSYPWPPPGGWYQAGDGKWWPEGYGPQEEDLIDNVESADSSTTSESSTKSDASTHSSDATSPVGSEAAGFTASAPEAPAGYSTASAVGGPSIRTSGSEIFERMQSESADQSARPWSSSEAVTQAPSLTGESTDLSSIVDGASSAVSESAGGFIERRGTDLGVGAAVAGAGAFVTSTDPEPADVDPASQVDEPGVANADHGSGYPTDYVNDQVPAGDPAVAVDQVEPTNHVGSPAAEYSSPEPSDMQYTSPEYVAPDFSDSEYSSPTDGTAAGYVPDGATGAAPVDSASALEQPIPGQQLPPDYSDGFSSSYSQGSYSEPDNDVDQSAGLVDATSAAPGQLDSPVETNFEAPVVNGVSSVQDVGDHVDAQVAERPGAVPWEDPSVDTALNPIVRAEGPQDAVPDALAPGASIVDRPGSPMEPQIAGQLPRSDPFASAPGSGPAFDDGRFVSSDSRGQMGHASRGPLLAPPVRDQPKRGRGRGLLMGLVVLAALALAGLAGFFFYQQQQGDDTGGAEVAASDSDDAAAGSLSNPHDSSRAVQIEYTAEDVAQVWTIQATSSAQTDLGSSTEIQADLTLANGNADGAAALADLIVSVIDSNGEVLASGANDCANTQAMSWGQSVAGGTSVSGPVCWVIPTESVEGILLGIESTKAQGRIHIQLPG